MKILEQSILRRLLGLQLAVLSIFLVAMTWLTYRAVMEFGSGEFDRQMMFTARALAQLGEPDVNDPRELKNTARNITQLTLEYSADFSSLPNYAAVFQLWSASGQLLFRTDLAPSTPLAELSPGLIETRMAGRKWRVATARSPGGSLYAQVAESHEMRDEMMELAESYFLHPLMWLALLLLSLTWLSAVRGLRPLNTLARQIETRSAADLAPVSAPVPYSETRPLVDSINDLIGRIQSTLANERNFLADAAHELRTPLAALQAQLHVLVHAQTAQERAAAEEDMRSAMARAAALLKQLLSIVRLESEAVPRQPQRTELAELVQERVAIFAKTALDKSVELDLDSPASCSAVVDRDAIVSLIDNLVDNAVRYVHAGGRVSVALSNTDGAIVLRVADDGPGIAAAERDRVFERFRRLPGNDEPGSGLGLAIVRRVVLLHGGAIRISDGLGGRGVTIEVRLPGRTEPVIF